MVIAVGVVMGIHACYGIFVKGVEMNRHVFVTYLPVSLLYIFSMAIGYLGLRYIELSVSTPICNSSGAVVAVLIFATEGISDNLPPAALAAVAFVGIGVSALGVVEVREDEDLRRKRQDVSNYHYAKSPLAILIPVAYCVIDAAGTFADSKVLETLNEDSANCAYELTFLFIALLCFLYVKFVKKSRFISKFEIPKYLGAVCETAGQFFYIYALADKEHVAYTAPIISSYCVVSVLWSRLILKEKLSARHYGAILTVVIGIIILGVLDI